MEQKNKGVEKNKGFSLVELIVVITIMAILVGAIAPQVIKYVEKARESKDLQVASNLLTSLTTAIGGSETNIGSFSVKSINSSDAGYSDIKAEVLSISGFANDKEILDSLKSQKGTKDWTIDASNVASAGLILSYDSTKDLITVQLGALMVSNK